MYVIVVGCGRVGAELAGAMSSEGHDVVIVDSDSRSFARLGSGFNGMTVTGTGIDEDVLKSAGIEQADAFAAVTGDDNANLMAAQIATNIFEIPRVVARVNSPRMERTGREFRIACVCPTSLGAFHLKNLLEANGTRTELALGGDIRVVRFLAGDAIHGKTVGEVSVPGRFMIFSVARGGKALIPDGGTELLRGDEVLAAARTDLLPKLRTWAGRGSGHGL